MLTFLFTLAIVVVVAGGLVYLVKLAPIPEWIKQAFGVVVAIIVIVWLLMELRKYLPGT